MKKILTFLVLVLFFSCDKEEPIPTYTLSVIPVPSEGGSITVSPQSPSYNEGTQVTLLPQPNEGYLFKNWEGDESGNSNPLSVIMNSNKSIVGVFIKREYPLTIMIEGEGTVTEEIVTNPSGREYPHGTTVKLTPVAKQGWKFDGWSGDLTGIEFPKNILVDKAKTVTAKFRKSEYELKITIEGEGSVEEKVVSTPNGKVYPVQTVVELTPKPSDGWIFDSWSGDLTGKEFPKNVTIDKEKNVTIKFILNPNFYLAENGITCKCPNAKPGEKGLINGVLYEAVDNELIRNRVKEKADLSKLCTSLVSDMKGLLAYSEQNPQINHWDVSNVTDMSFMFDRSTFNQPIGSWDVSKVTNMANMFSESLFNQPIGNWNVSSVKNMSSMFIGGQYFGTQGNGSFNQPIGNWDVSNVLDMSYMFAGIEQGNRFNQPIGNWNVKNVTNMIGMFEFSDFNQPIGNWNVGNVSKMEWMFSSSSFNQDISKWCVSKIPSEPQGFSAYSPLSTQNKPKWGTCP